MMNILVQGAGALGVYFGGRILEAGYNVSYFVRERRAAQLEKEGLVIKSPEGDFTSQDFKIYTTPESVENIDLIILAIKGYHLQQAIPQIQTIVERTGAFVLPLLNGVEQLDLLQKAVGKEKVIGGFAGIIATLNEKGHVVHSNNSSVVRFGALHEAQIEICEKLAEVGRNVKTKILQEKDILKHMWKKYIFITSFSGITSATQLTSGYIAENEATLAVAQNIVYEMSMLAEKEGISLTEKEIESMANNIKIMHPEATSSMHQDMRKGLPLEVEHLQGGALRIAAKHGVEIPVIQTIYGILKPYENGRLN